MNRHFQRHEKARKNEFASVYEWEAHFEQP